jgi:hypothetical protein
MWVNASQQRTPLGICILHCFQSSYRNAWLTLGHDSIRVADRTGTSVFSATVLGRCMCQLIWLPYHFKIISNLKQDVYVSIQPTQTLPDPTTCRTIKTQKKATTDSNFLLPFTCNLHSVENMTLCRKVIEADDIL